MIVLILVAAFIITLALAFSDFLLVMAAIAAILGLIVWIWHGIQTTTWGEVTKSIELFGDIALIVGLAWAILTAFEKFKRKTDITAPPDQKD